MIAILGGVVGGIGLFFMGARLLSEHLKALADRRVRMSAARWTGSHWAGCAWGIIAGAITQSMQALTFISIGMLRSGLLTARRTMLLLIGGNVGVVLMLLIVMYDIRLAVLYVLGAAHVITAIATKGNSGNTRLQTMSAALFGMGTMVLGFLVLRESVAPLSNDPWFTSAVHWAIHSSLLCLAVGLAMCILVQSTAVVVISVAGMAATGLFDVEQIMLIHAGACLGSGLILYLLSINLKGRPRQVAMFQVLHNCALFTLFAPVVLAEVHLGVPLIKAVLLSVNLPLEQLLGIYFIFCEVIIGMIQLVFFSAFERTLARWWPATEVERLSEPQFVHDRALDDPEISMLLADREQRRLLDIFSRCLDTVRRDVELGGLRPAANDVLNRIGEFLEDLGARYPDRGVEDHVSLLTRQRLFFWLDERVLELCAVLHATPRRSALEAWRMGLVEGVDAILMTLGDMLSTEDESSCWSMAEILDDRSEKMRRMRSTHFGGESHLTTHERMIVLRVTSATEHVFLLLTKLAHEYRRAAAPPAPKTSPVAKDRPSAAAVADDTVYPGRAIMQRTVSSV